MGRKKKLLEAQKKGKAKSRVRYPYPQVYECPRFPSCEDCVCFLSRATDTTSLTCEQCEDVWQGNRSTSGLQCLARLVIVWSI